MVKEGGELVDAVKDFIFEPAAAMQHKAKVEKLSMKEKQVNTNSKIDVKTPARIIEPLSQPASY
jgi:hypothetical protein